MIWALVPGKIGGRYRRLAIFMIPYCFSGAAGLPLTSLEMTVVEGVQVQAGVLQVIYVENARDLSDRTLQ